MMLLPGCESQDVRLTAGYSSSSSSSNNNNDNMVESATQTRQGEKMK